jgi:glycosyltransferase involved in cell wall biosynthesis
VNGLKALINNMESSPLVSVLMTSYNREKYISQAIESVLNSSYTNFELIIVDDGSTDKTVFIAKSYEAKDSRIKLYQNDKNLGDYHNRNKAASYASGKYIKYVDSDDLIYPYGLETFVKGMEKFPEAALGVISKNPIPIEPFPILLSSEKAIRQHFFGSGLLDYGPTGVIIKKDVFESLGAFSGKRFVGDTECWLKIASRYSVVELPPSLTFWRRHEGQEFLTGMNTIDDGYFTMTLPMLKEFFNSESCPLSNDEKEKILRKERKARARQLIKFGLKTGNIRKTDL